MVSRECGLSGAFRHFLSGLAGRLNAEGEQSTLLMMPWSAAFREGSGTSQPLTPSKENHYTRGAVQTLGDKPRMPPGGTE